MSCFLYIFDIIPKNFLSYLVGAIVRLRLPQPISNFLCRGFVVVFGIDMKEAELPLSSYKTIEDVFTRKLTPGQRVIESDLVSPADGILSRSEPAVNGTAIQAKGLTYRLDELVYGEVNDRTSLTWYSTIYLAPHNYHRVHSSVPGMLVGIRYFPGELWPVNKPFAKITPNLFVRNERLVFEIELSGGGKVHVAMVGALNVGRIKTPHLSDFATNDFSAKKKFQHFILEKPVAIKTGDELGTFMLGSTAVVVFDETAAGRYKILQSDQPLKVKMGQTLIQEHN